MEKQNWVMIRNGEVKNVFLDRKGAIKHFKELLEQTLKDFEKQDKTDEFDYEVKIPETVFKPVDKRESFLSLM